MFTAAVIQPSSARIDRTRSENRTPKVLGIPHESSTGAVGITSVPLGEFFIRSAYRSDLVGLLAGTATYSWNVRRG
jgi:hypothetical protein